MKFIYLFIAFFISFNLKASFEENKKIDTINVGYYIDDIYDIDYVMFLINQSFKSQE